MRRLFLQLCAVILAITSVAAQSNVTFRVDMSQYGGSTANGVFVNGTWNGWCGSCNPLTDANNDGIWEGTFLIPNGQIEYKFTVDGWTDQENFTPGLPCVLTTGGFTNRVYTVAGNVTLPTVCWNSCAACGASTSSDVTFRVDMSQYGGSTASGVFVNGTWNGWCGSCNPLTDANNDGIWEGTYNVPNGQIEYKFTVNGWTDQENFLPGMPCVLTTSGFTNRVYTVAGNTTLPTVCWNSCAACGVSNSSDVTFSVDMSQYTGSTANGVFVNGNWNSWCGSCNPLTDTNNDGIWEGTFNISHGTIEYKFTVDGWTDQENFVPGMPCVLTTGAFTNRVYTVSNPATLPTVCWESCAACPAAPVNINVTFRVDMTNETVAPSGVFMGADFDGWSGNIAMTDANNDGIWEYTTTLLSNTSYEWKFINGASWANPEQFDAADAACTINTTGFINRYATTGSGDTTLPAFYFNSCDFNANVCTTDRPTWTNLSPNAVVLPDGSLQKSNNAAGFNEGASSAEQLMAGEDGWVEMVLTNNKTKAFGFSNVDVNYTDKTIDFGFRSKTNMSYNIIEGGKTRFTSTYQLGDVFRVQRFNSQIFYLVNGTVKHVSNATSTSQLLVDVSLSSGKTIIDDVKISFPCGDPMTPCTDPNFNVGSSDFGVCQDSTVSFDLPMYYNTYWYELGGSTTPVFTTTNGGSVMLSSAMPMTYVIKGVNMLTGCVGYDTLEVFTDTTCCELHWTNVSTGVVVNPDGSITKTSTAGAHLGGFSEEYLPAGSNGSIRLVASTTNIYRAFGFSPSFGGTTINSIAYAIRLNANGTAKVIESGVVTGPTINITIGDVFEIRRVDTTVTYLHNGSVFYTSTVGATTDLYVNSTIVTSGGTIEPISNNFLCPCFDNAFYMAVGSDTICYNAMYHATAATGYTTSWYDAQNNLVATDNGMGVDLMPSQTTTYYIVAVNNSTGCIAYDTITVYVNQGLTWTNFSGSTFADANNRLRRVNQTGSTVGFTEGASSVESLGMNEDGWIELTVEELRSKAFGFSEVDTDYDFKTILYGFQMLSTGVYKVFENGKSKYQGTYSVGRTLRIERTAGVVTFSINGNVVYTSPLLSTAPLIVDASIASNNTSLERISTSFICPPAGAASRVVLPSATTTANDNRTNAILDNQIRVLPNPTNGILNVQSEKIIERILVVDMFGRVLRQIHGTNTNQVTISIEDLAAGIYLINVDGKTMKVVKQ